MQRTALHHQDRCHLALDAQRSATLGRVYQQAQRWLNAGCFEQLAHDLRAVLRSTPESGARARYDGAKRKKGPKRHMLVDTLGHMLAAGVTPATADDRAEVGRLALAVQAATGESVDLADVDQS